jgi:hypothetical protein
LGFSENSGNSLIEAWRLDAPVSAFVHSVAHSPAVQGGARRCLAGTRESSVPIAVAEAILEESLLRPEQLPDALDLAGQMLGLDYFGLVSADFSRPRYIMSARQSEALDAYFKGGWIEDDYRIRGESAMPTGELFLDHINVDDQVRRSSAVYNEFFLPNDMVNYAGIRFEVDGAHWFCAAARGETRGVIDDQTAWKFVRMANTAIRSVSVASRLEATDRKSTRLNSSHRLTSRMPSSA